MDGDEVAVQRPAFPVLELSIKAGDMVRVVAVRGVETGRVNGTGDSRQRGGHAVDRFLSIANKNGITVDPVLFDDCTFGDPPVTEPYLGKQRDPIPVRFQAAQRRALPR